MCFGVMSNDKIVLILADMIVPIHLQFFVPFCFLLFLSDFRSNQNSSNRKRKAIKDVQVQSRSEVPALCAKPAGTLSLVLAPKE